MRVKLQKVPPDALPPPSPPHSLLPLAPIGIMTLALSLAGAVLLLTGLAVVTVVVRKGNGAQSRQGQLAASNRSHSSSFSFEAGSHCVVLAALKPLCGPGWPGHQRSIASVSVLGSAGIMPHAQLFSLVSLPLPTLFSSLFPITSLRLMSFSFFGGGVCVCG